MRKNNMDCLQSTKPSISCWQSGKYESSNEFVSLSVPCFTVYSCVNAFTFLCVGIPD